MNEEFASRIPQIHGTFPRKIDLRFDRAGAPILIMIETTPDRELHYYMQQDGSWMQYDPARQTAKVFSNDRFTAYVDATDWRLVTGGE